MDSTITRRVGAIAAAAGLALGGGVLAGSLDQDSALAAGPRTLVYDATLIPSETKEDDLAPMGYSPADTSVNVAALTKGEKPAGRFHIVSTIVAGGGGGGNMAIPGAAQRAGDLVAVVGGTGTYAGASGTLEVGDSETKGTERVTIRLR